MSGSIRNASLRLPPQFRALQPVFDTLIRLIDQLDIRNQGAVFADQLVLNEQGQIVLGTGAQVQRAVNTTSPLTGGGQLTVDRTIAIGPNGIGNALLRQGAAASVVGRPDATPGDLADIVSAANGQFLVRRAGILGFGALVDGDIPAGIARDSEVSAAIANHEGASDPHPGYLTQAEGDALYQPANSALDRIYTGSGSPEAAVTAPAGSLYLRQDGGAGTTLYVKESGAGNTGWAAK